jgi:orotidine-5'-phosphate decarboxylase
VIHGPLSRLAVALDTSDRQTLREWIRFFGPRVGVLKLGLEAFVTWGPAAVREAKEQAHSVFLDLKLHDIPNTVAAATAAARQLGVTYLTVHAGGGTQMLAAAVAAAGSETKILAVTVLTHLELAELQALDLPGGVSDRVLLWAQLAQRAGCAGVVCSPLEAATLRAALPPPFLLVTPGIRARDDGNSDQRRTATAEQARQAGSDLVVIGRPLTTAADPLSVLAQLDRSLA